MADAFRRSQSAKRRTGFFMSLLVEQVQKFQQLYREEFGEDLSYEVAYDKGIKLVRLMEIILKNEDRKLKSNYKINNK